MAEKTIKKVYRMLSAIFFLWSMGFAGINLGGDVWDAQTQQGIDGANISIAGTNLSTTSSSDGSFTIMNFPRFSTGFQVKASKSGYVSTYTYLGNVWNEDVSDISFPVFSTILYNSMHTSGGVSHIAGKSDIGGMVSGQDGGISGVVITAKYLDNNANAGTIRYVNTSNLPDSSLTSTSENGAFIIYNVEPDKPIRITATKQGLFFSSSVVIGYPDSVSTCGVEQVQNMLELVSTVVWDDVPVSGVSISFPGTNISTTSGIDGTFSMGFPPTSYGVLKLSKQGYVDTYYSGGAEKEDNKVKDGEEDNTFEIIPQDFYNSVLQNLGKTHIQGKGDITGDITTPDGFNMAGVTVNLYDKNGALLSPDIIYFDEDGMPSTELTSTTSDSSFLVLNLDPGYYYITGVKNGFEFGRCLVIVFANGITFAPEIISYPPVPGIQKVKPEEIPATNVSNTAQNVPMLSFSLNLMSGPGPVSENVILDSVIVTSKGTGNTATSLSSAKLYLDSDNNGTYETEVSTGVISGNKITFFNINKEVSMGLNQRYLVVFNFNGSASIGQTFGVDILKNADVSAHAENSQLPITCEGDPLIGNLMTIIEANPPSQPQNQLPFDGAIEIDPFNYILQSSSFNSGQGNSNHIASEWRMWKDGESSELFTYDQVSQMDLTYIVSPVILEGLTQYWWQVRYKNGDNLWSDWSTPTSFTTASGGVTPPSQPANQSPDDGATEVQLPVVLTGSSFSPGSSYTHIASQWQVFLSGQKVCDSGRTETSLLSITITSLSSNTTYSWRVRYQDSNGAWSQWSNLTSFTTKQGMKGDLNQDTGIDISDVILCLRMAIDLDSVDIYLADMNNDQQVDISDVILILRKAIGLDL